MFEGEKKIQSIIMNHMRTMVHNLKRKSLSITVYLSLRYNRLKVNYHTGRRRCIIRIYIHTLILTIIFSKMKFDRLFLYSKQASRPFSSSQASRATFAPGPAPPRLPKAEQDLCEELQRSSNGAFSTPNATAAIANLKASQSNSQRPISSINQSPYIQPDPIPAKADKVTHVKTTGQSLSSGEELHPDIRKGVQPEFEGERNPKTGEVGGPKNEPLRWGGEVDWSYNGRVTDF